MDHPKRRQAVHVYLLCESREFLKVRKKYEDKIEKENFECQLKLTESK